MRKLPIIALVLWTTAAALFAQDAGEFTFGVRGGILFGFHEAGSDLRDLSGGYTPEEDPLFNPNIAAYGNYAVTDKLAIQGELNLMINQGMKFSIYGYSIEATGISLDIPVLLKYALMTDQARFGILAGPHFSIPLGKFKTSGYYSGEYDPDGFAYGITAGLFAGYPVGSGRIVGDLRFIYDLSPMKIKDYGHTMEVIKRRGLAVTVGYEISF
jgi:hypothetical protein